MLKPGSSGMTLPCHPRSAVEAELLPDMGELLRVCEPPVGHHHAQCLQPWLGEEQPREGGTWRRGASAHAPEGSWRPGEALAVQPVSSVGTYFVNGRILDSFKARFLPATPNFEAVAPSARRGRLPEAAHADRDQSLSPTDDIQTILVTAGDGTDRPDLGVYPTARAGRACSSGYCVAPPKCSTSSAPLSNRAKAAAGSSA